MRDEIFKLETNLDDCTGETLAYCMEKLFEAGAKDVWYTPIFMKKGRPAYALSVMCREDVKDACIKVIFRETSAIGMRVSLQVRVIMDREAVTVDTPYGPVDSKQREETRRSKQHPALRNPQITNDSSDSILRSFCFRALIGFRRNGPSGACQAIPPPAFKASRCSPLRTIQTAFRLPWPRF